MIKIIYGVTDQSSDCELRFPLQDNIEVLDLVKQSIINDVIPEETIGSFVYSIYCIGNFYVFSKINIVLGGKTQRKSYRAFMIALEENEIRENGIIDELTDLETKHNNDKTNEIQQITTNINIKKNKSKILKQTVVIYYKGENDLKKNFKCFLEAYKKCEIIYFIDEEQYSSDKDNEKYKQNPINALVNCDREFQSFDEFLYAFVVNPDKQPNNASNNKNKGNGTLKETTKRIILNRIVIGIFGILIGIFGVWGYQKMFPNLETVAKSEYNEKMQEINNLQTLIAEKDSIINVCEDTTKSLEKVTPQQNISSNTPSNSSGRNNNVSPLESEIDDFFKKDCKAMNLNQINNNIRSYSNWESNGRLVSFSKFVTLMAKNPPSKQEITNFINANESNFNEGDEYVKFVRYLAGKEDVFFNANTKNIYGIYNKTLQTIELKYDYNQ